MASKYVQTNRPLKVYTPYPENTLLIERFEAFERLSQPFVFQLDLIAAVETVIDFKLIMGQGITVSVASADGLTERYFHGIVNQFTQGQQVGTASGDAQFIRYRAQLVPSFSLMNRNRNMYINQQLTVQKIITDLLSKADVLYEDKMTTAFKPRDYCTQYRESDYQFISRLLEEEGVTYYFKHENGKHTLVLTDASSGYGAMTGIDKLTYKTAVSGDQTQNLVVRWEKTQTLQAGKITVRDQKFEMVENTLGALAQAAGTVSAGTVTHALDAGMAATQERYDFPGQYAHWFDGVKPGGADDAGNLNNIFTENKRIAKVRLEEELRHVLLIQGQGNCRMAGSGYSFQLAEHPHADGEYVFTSVKHLADMGEAYTSNRTVKLNYFHTFEAIPKTLVYRPDRVTPLPRTTLEHAIVVGQAGKEIFTDKYGRVKVQFLWDRVWPYNETSSCWVRVATPWAGPQWGMVHVPRVGHEVIVDFLGGDPDQPVIVGSVYNNKNMPPYVLPDNATQSGIKSRSSLKGTADEFNEIRFEDKKGEEHLYVHAQKDYQRIVENNDTHTIGSSNSQYCPDGSQTMSIWKNRTITIETGNETLNVKKGNREVNVDTGNDTHNVKLGNREVNINTGNDTLNIKTGNQTTTISLGASSTTAMQKIELKVGPSSITIDPTGVTIKGMNIKIEGTIMTEVKGNILCKLESSALTQVKGGIVMIN